MQRTNIKMIVEAGVMIALAYILSLLKVWQAPMGGSVTAGSMIPIILFSIRWGYKKGVLIAVLYGTIQFILGPKWSFHPVSILFDYIFAFGVLGFAGFFNEGKTKIVSSILAAIGLRFICHVISGVVVFASYAPEGMSASIYSLIYNAQYLIPEFIISSIVVVLLYEPLKQNKILV